MFTDNVSKLEQGVFYLAAFNNEVYIFNGNQDYDPLRLAMSLSTKPKKFYIKKHDATE